MLHIYIGLQELKWSANVQFIAGKPMSRIILGAHHQLRCCEKARRVINLQYGVSLLSGRHLERSGSRMREIQLKLAFPQMLQSDSTSSSQLE